MGHPSSDEPRAEVGNRYALVMAVAKRAKQLREGAPKLVESRSRNTITVALEEILSGKVKLAIPTPEELEAAERKVMARPEVSEAAELLRVTDEALTQTGDEAAEVETGEPQDKIAEEQAESLLETEDSGESNLQAEPDEVQELLTPGEEEPLGETEEGTEE